MNEALKNVRHARSKKDFPHLKLEEGEYVELAFSRAKICLTAIMAGTIAAFAIILLVFIITMASGVLSSDDMGRNFLAVVFTTIIAVIFIAAIISLRIYRGNKLFITNKRVMQFSMTSLVSSSVNIIDLSSIEDASFHQKNIFQKIFKYGTLRLSTIGDETTYTFPYSDISAEELKQIAYLVSNVKKSGGHHHSKKETAEASESSENA
jgi:hypothetical protein